MLFFRFKGEDFGFTLDSPFRLVASKASVLVSTFQGLRRRLRQIPREEFRKRSDSPCSAQGIRTTDPGRVGKAR